MENCERTGGGSFHFRGGLHGVFLEMQLLELGVHDVGAENADHEKTHEQKQRQALEGAAVVEPLRDEVSQADASAPLLHNEVAVNEDLRRCSGVGYAQQLLHLIGKECGRPGKSEKEDCSHPDRGVQDPNKSKKPEHGVSLRKTREVPSLTFTEPREEVRIKPP